MFTDLAHSLQTSRKLSEDTENLAVPRQFCKLINSKVMGQKLSVFLVKQLKIPDDSFASNHITFEASSINHRHMKIQLATLVLLDWEKRLEILWRNKAVRYNYLATAFHDDPSWYNSFQSAFNRLIH